MKIRTLSQLVDLAEAQSRPISAIVTDFEVRESGKDLLWIRSEMVARIKIMRDAMAEGLANPVSSKSGLVRGAAFLMERSRLAGQTIVGGLFSRAIAGAMAVPEVNACMGRIVAAPTAGSSGVLPGTLIVVADELGKSDDDLVAAFITAAGIGMAIEAQATLSGAEGGCQAECGAASAMAAGALVEMMGDAPRRVASAVALALQNVLGLICDPVAGLVEVPCVSRNVLGAVNALACAEMAMAGIESRIPADEVIVAMGRVGHQLPSDLRETGRGGMATTPTAQALPKSP